MEAAKVWLLRRMLNLGWTSHTSNQEVFNRIKSEKVMKTILKRQLGYLGHVLRMGGFRNFMPYCERGTSRPTHGGQRDKYGLIRTALSVDAGGFTNRTVRSPPEIWSSTCEDASWHNLTSAIAFYDKIKITLEAAVRGPD